MKKLLMVVILLGLSWIMHAPALADAGFQLEEASLDTEWSETNGSWMTGYQLKAGADWEWLKLGLTGKSDDSDSAEAGSTLKLAVDLPKLEDQLGIDTQYTWNARYQIFNAKADYSRGFGEYWKVGLNYENEQREGLIEDSAQYSRQSDQGSISLGVEYEPWKYQIKCLGQISDYPNDTIKRFSQTGLQQEISRSLGKDLGFTLYYQEMARNFPEDYLSNRWEAKYGLQGNWQASENWQWKWDYYRLNREYYNSTEERQSLKLELESVFDKNNKLISQFRVSDCSSEFDEEYQATISEDDPQAHLPPTVPTRKLAVKFLHNFLNCSLEVGAYYSEEDDQSTGNTTYRSGTFASFDWEYQQMNLTIKTSPMGDFQHQNPYYQVKISFEF